MADATTIIAIRDFTTKQRAFRLSASALGSFRDVIERTFTSFNRDPGVFTIHFHYRQRTPCTPFQTLNEQEWDAGEYFVGGRIEFFAHFVEKESGGGARAGIRARGDVRGAGAGAGAGAGRDRLGAPPRGPAGRRGSQAEDGRSRAPTVALMRASPLHLAPGGPPGNLPFEGYGGRPVPPPYPPPPFTVPPMGYLPYGPSPVPRPVNARPNNRQPSATARRRTTQQRQSRLNGSSTTVYSLGPPVPVEHYGNRPYYSGPCVFIPYPPRPHSPTPPAARLARPFPGFLQPEGSSHPDQQHRISEARLESQSDSTHPRVQLSAAARALQPAPTSPPVAASSRHRRRSSTPASLERIESPTYEPADGAASAPQSPPSRRSVARSSVASDGLFVFERSDPPDMQVLDWDEEDEEGRELQELLSSEGMDGE